MSPLIAFSICSAFVCAALLIDASAQKQSRVLWIPTVWAAIVASRPIGNWFNPEAGATLMRSSDGSSLDRIILIALMVAATIVLASRHLPWHRWRREYVWVCLFFLFCGISILWSDFPAVGFKRWIRAIGTLLMILVVASEKDPVAATAAVIRRSAIVLLPFSVILIKYFREFGVAYAEWTGELMLVGVTTDKNALGRLAMICGLFLFWQLLCERHQQKDSIIRLSRWTMAVLLLVALWLLYASDSKTSLACFVLGSVVMICAARPFVRERAAYIGTLILVVATTGLLLNFMFDLSGLVLQALNRDPTLTDRTYIWNDLLAFGTNPLVGVGYDTFWLGDRLALFVEDHGVASAHNGYLEAYLEIGSVGLVLLVCFLIGTFGRIRATLVEHVPYARLLAAMLTVFVLYNWTESSYKPTTFVCFTLLLVSMTSPRPQERQAPENPVLQDGRQRTRGDPPPRRSTAFGPPSSATARPYHQRGRN